AHQQQALGSSSLRAVQDQCFAHFALEVAVFEELLQAAATGRIQRLGGGRELAALEHGEKGTVTFLLQNIGVTGVKLHELSFCDVCSMMAWRLRAGWLFAKRDAYNAALLYGRQRPLAGC